MTLNIALPPETETKLRERADAAGTDVPTFVREAIEEKLRIAKDSPATPQDSRRDAWRVGGEGYAVGVTKRIVFVRTERNTDTRELRCLLSGVWIKAWSAWISGFSGLHRRGGGRCCPAFRSFSGVLGFLRVSVVGGVVVRSSRLHPWLGR